MDLSMPVVKCLPTPAPRTSSVFLSTKSKTAMTATANNGEKKRLWTTTFNFNKPRLDASPRLVSLSSTTKLTVPKTTVFITAKSNTSSTANMMTNSMWQSKHKSDALDESILYPKTAELLPELKTLSELSKHNYSVEELQNIRRTISKKHLYFNWDRNAAMKPLVNHLQNLGIYYGQYNRCSMNQRFAEFTLWRSER